MSKVGTDTKNITILYAYIYYYYKDNKQHLHLINRSRDSRLLSFNLHSIILTNT